MKRVLVTMSDECAAMLKSYAALYHQTQSEVIYESIRRDIHRQAVAGCRETKSLLRMNRIKIDRRAYKECYGYQCRYCSHDKACRVGMYEGEWQCENRYKHLLTPTVEPE